MSERLTILTTKGPALKLDNPGNEEEARQQLHDKYLEAIGKLYYLEVLQEAGRLVELPCNAGGTVFVINGKYVLDFEIDAFNVDETGAWLMNLRHYDDKTKRAYLCNKETEEIGKTVLLTREEAEAELERRMK